MIFFYFHGWTTYPNALCLKIRMHKILEYVLRTGICTLKDLQVVLDQIKTFVIIVPVTFGPTLPYTLVSIGIQNTGRH